MDATAFFQDDPHHLRERRWLRRLAMSIVRDEAVADDLVQEVSLQVLRCGALPDEPRLRLAYLARAIRHVAARFVLKRRSDQRKHEAAAESPRRPTAADAYEHAETERQLLDAILRLPTEQRDAVLLRYYEDLRPREVAVRLSIPVERVYKILAEARAGLRIDLEQNGLGPQWAVVLVGWSAARPATRTFVMSSASVAFVVLCIPIAGLFAWSSHNASQARQPEGERLASSVTNAPADHVAVDPTSARVEASEPPTGRAGQAGVLGEPVPASPQPPSRASQGPHVAWRSPVVDGEGMGPRGLAVASNHEIFQVDYKDNSIHTIDYLTGRKTGRTVQPPDKVEYLSCVIIDGDRLFASCPRFGAIAFDLQTLEEKGRVEADDPGHAWLLNGICVDSRGHVHLLGSADSKVHVYDHDFKQGEIATWECGPLCELLFSLPGDRILVSRGDGHATTLDLYSLQGEALVPSGPCLSAELKYHVMDVAIAASHIFIATEQDGVFVYRLPASLGVGTSLVLEHWIPPCAGLQESERSNLSHMAADPELSRVYLAYDQPARTVVAVDLSPDDHADLEQLGLPPKLQFEKH